MTDVFVRFEREDHEGIVAVGSYISDCANRFGLNVFEQTLPEKDHQIEVIDIVSGAELLSEPLKEEMDILRQINAAPGKRLASYTRIDNAGEVTIMTGEPKKDNETIDEKEARAEEFKKEFAELPLEKKISNLVDLEMMAMSETLSFVLNSPFKVGEKFLDILSEFGYAKEETEKASVRPAEHVDAEQGYQTKSDETATVEETIVEAEPRTDDPPNS